MAREKVRTAVLLLFNQYRCWPLRMKYLNFQLLYRSPRFLIHPLWSGSPICAKTLSPSFKELTAPLLEGGAALAHWAGAEVVRLRKTAGFCPPFSFTIGGGAASPILGLIDSSVPFDVVGRGFRLPAELWSLEMPNIEDDLSPAISSVLPLQTF